MNINDMISYFMAGMVFLTLVTVLLLIFVLKLKSWMPDLFELIREGFIHSGQDLQTINSQLRQEVHQSIALFQDSLLKVVSENLSVQKAQLDSFEKALDRTTQAMLSRQDVFSEKLEKGLQGMDQSIRTDALKAREELKENFTSFEKMLHGHFGPPQSTSIEPKYHGYQHH